MQKLLASVIFVCFLTDIPVSAQKITKRLTLDEVIRIAQDQSLQAILAKHRYRGSYWQYRTFKAKYLPHLSLSSTIFNFDRSIKQSLSYENREWVERIGESKSLNSSGRLDLSQNIGITGGSIFLSSQLARNDRLQGDSLVRFISSPVSIGFRQPINGYNELNWEKKIEPKRYEEAKKQYIDAMEAVSIRAVNYFFDLALAQMNLEISRINYSNTDTLYKIAVGRFNMGTIAENELLQLELSHLNAGANLNSASIDLEVNKFQLRSFLGFNENVDLELIIPANVPMLDIDVIRALDEARKNNPDIIGLERQLIEAERDVAVARSEKGLNATLYASFGLTNEAPDINGVYLDPQDQQQVQIGIELPIVDWGLNRGRLKMAQSNQQVVMTSVQQEKVDFEQQVLLSAMQFNMQDDQLLIAAKADTVASYRYEVAKRRFLIGKIDVLDLNVALEEKDVARRGYIAALREFWSYYFNIRRLTLFDFISNKPLTASFDDLLD
ncbi:MAG: TolC family protein [Bacteroidales bacterium]|nr:TolC family protein [Bacteroidales bacterium]